MNTLLRTCGAATLLLAGCDDSTSPEPASELATSSTPAVSIVDLGVQGFATDIAANGRIAGHTDGAGSAGAFVWSHGQLTYLDAPENDSKAAAINPSGMVAGYRGATPHAVVWDRGGVIELGVLPGTQSSLAQGMNSAGQVVGRSDNSEDFSSRVFLWEKGVLKDLGSMPDFPATDPFDINQQGQIVGAASNGDTPRAFLLENGVFRDLGTLGGDGGAAAAINSAGQIVGWSMTSTGALHAFVWQNGSMTDLGTFPGGNESIATDINSAGQIVGVSNNANGEYHAFRWENGVMTDLGTLPGGISSSAGGINDEGDVVGFSGTATGEARATLWRIE
jgi:probable HAF family extracellular repeat protein